MDNHNENQDLTSAQAVAGASTQGVDAGGDVVADPIIRTKLHRPPPTSDYVQRDRLLQHMDRALEVPLTLVSGPAGTGKSVLVSAWIESRDVDYSWLSLDASDGDMRRFLGYLLASLERVCPDMFARTKEMLVRADLPPTRVLASYLINDLDRVAMPVVVIIDDYHLLPDSSSVHELVRMLLQHPSRDIHLVLCSRRDPPLALSTLRASGWINDVRMGELLFTDTECAELLTQVSGQQLQQRQIDKIQENIEGWAAGLRLVALALRQADDKDAFIKQLGGNIPDTTAYLMDEVLGALPASVRGYLITTAVLEQFCPELLDAIHSGSEASPSSEINGERFVELLQQMNLFVIPLDAHGRWFRYHHLFKDMLSDGLKQICSADEIHALHARASEWFERQGRIEEAIRHALAGADQEGAADIIERHRHEPLDEDRWWILRDWLDMLGIEVKQKRIGILLSHGWVSYFNLRFDVISLILGAVDSLLEKQAVEPIMQAELSFLRSVVLYWEGNGVGCQRCCDQAIAVFPAPSSMVAAEVRVYRALAQHMNGDTAAAVKLLKSDIKNPEMQSGLVVTRLLVALAFVGLLSGDLDAAQKSASELSDVAARTNLSYAKLWGALPHAIASFYMGRPSEAIEQFSLCAERRFDFEYRAAADALAGKALCSYFLGNAESAIEAIDESLEFAAITQNAECAMVAESCQARLALLLRRTDAALRWARSADITPYPPGMVFWIEIPEMTQLRILVVAGTDAERQESLGVLTDIRSQAESLNLVNRVIEISVLNALALEKLGRIAEANIALIEAVGLAAPNGWIQPFIEAGEPLVGKLAGIAEIGEHRQFIRRVLTAYDKFVALATPVTIGTFAVPRALGRAALNELTNRELDILELLAQRLRSKEIAARLNISTYTVKDHLKHVYQKLEVSNRRDAVARAASDGLLKESSPSQS